MLKRAPRLSAELAAVVRRRRNGGTLAACTLLIMILVVPILAAAQQSTEPAGAAHAIVAPTRLYLVIFSLGPAWVAGKPPGEQPAFREHGQNLKRLRDADRIALGARYADKGMIVLRSESESAARNEIAADPGVRAGIFTFEVNELVPFYSGYVGNSKN